MILFILGLNTVPSYEYYLARTTNLSIYNSTVNFVNNFLKVKISKSDCKIINYIRNIYINSFQITNYLGDYYSCSKHNMIFYYFLLYKSELTPDLINKNLADIYPSLIYEDYYAFAMCLPSCLELDNYFVINQMFNNHTYSLLYYNITNKTDTLYNQMSFTELFIIISILLFFLFLSLFFAFFPKYSHFKNWLRLFKYTICCTKERKYSQFEVPIEDDREEVNQIENTLSSYGKIIEKEEIKQQAIVDMEEEKSEKIVNDNKIGRDSLVLEAIDVGKSGIYEKISNVFNLNKSIKRLFENNQFVNKINSKFVNDNSVGFVNGLKAINMLVMILNVVCWQLFLLPTTKSTLDHNYISSPDKIFFQIVILYYMYFSFCVYWCLNGFLLGYKFLFHLKTRKIIENYTMKKATEKGKTDRNHEIWKMFTFVFQQFYLYLLFIFMFILTLNLEKFVYILNQKNRAGTLLFFYSEISEKLREQLQYFLIPLLNFLVGNVFEFKEGSSIFFFYSFINEMQAFLISIIILFIYSKKRNDSNILVIVFLIYIFSLVIKILTYSIEERNYKDLVGIDAYFWKLTSAFSIYYIGVVMGLLFFEYNSGGISYSRIHSFSSQESLDESEEINGKNKLKENLKWLFSKHSSLYIIAFIFVLCFIFFMDFISVFSVMKNRKLNVQIPLIFKLYFPIEVDLFLIGLFIILFRLFLVEKSEMREFFERKVWIGLSRSFYVVMFLTMPISLLIVLNSNVTLKITFLRIVLIFIGLCAILLIVSSIIVLVIVVPLKVLFKQILNKNL
jgi:hypothetical protein